MKKLVIPVLVAVFAVIVVGFVVVKAQTSSLDVSGWAWSSNIGWVSFNSTDSGAGGGPYKVVLNTDGTLTGYAWSSNIGWISFNSSDISGCSGGTAAHVSGGSVYGFARAMAGVGRTDGWDGCIELSGTNHSTGDLYGNSGVTYNSSTGLFNGFAWGSDVVGWLQFNLQTQVASSTNPIVACGGNSTITGTGPWTVTWDVSATDGAGGPFTFSSDGSTYDSVLTSIYNATGTYAVTVTAQDVNSNTSNSYTCPSVTITSNTGKSQSISGVSVLLKPSNSSIYKSAIQVPQGNSFDVKWNIPSPFTASGCTSINTITPVDSSSVTWKTAWNSAISANLSSSLPSLSTSVASTGQYNFRIKCSYTDPVTNKTQATSSSATVFVTASNIIEI